MGIVNFRCKNCNKLLGFLIDDVSVVGEKEVKYSGISKSRNKFDSITEYNFP